jgi:hypothetical protein
VELSSIEAHKRVERIDFRGLGVHKEADSLDTRGKLRAHGGGFHGRNAAKALLVEIKAEHVGTRVAGGFGVRPIGNAADLDEDHSLPRPEAQSGREKFPGLSRDWVRASSFRR